MKTIAIMQPYFFPYIGYFQLMNAVDEFVLYDQIEFSKRGWIHRNRILVNSADSYISLPLKSDSDYLSVDQRALADSWLSDRRKMLNRIRESYRKAPYFTQVFLLVEQCILAEETNLFRFIHHSLVKVRQHLQIETPLVISSTIGFDAALKGPDKVLALCKARGAGAYINPIGGVDLYTKAQFRDHGIELSFLRAKPTAYAQFGNPFVPFLSIIDVMMFNSIDRVRELLCEYSLE